MDPTTANTPIPALFRFNIHNATTTTYVSHTHPVPLFLCHPTPSQQTSSVFASAFIDIIALITAQHHTECMTLLSSPCLACASPTTDCLKAPSSFLNLVEPLVVISVYPVCGSAKCQYAVRCQILRQQKQRVEAAKEDEAKIYGKMVCAVCRLKDAKRCAGCGTVAYCSKQCQTEGWKVHKRDCRRRYKPKKEEEEEEGVKAVKDVPYETI